MSFKETNAVYCEDYTKHASIWRTKNEIVTVSTELSRHPKMGLAELLFCRSWSSFWKAKESFELNKNKNFHNLDTIQILLPYTAMMARLLCWNCFWYECIYCGIAYSGIIFL
jgi:hypothetical protein